MTDELYNIKHCIWCGRKDFKDANAVIKHIKEEHTRAE